MRYNWREIHMTDSIVFIPEENVYGNIIKHSAYFSIVKYTRDGMEYEISLPNEDLIFVVTYQEEEE